jgi:L-alanine-DL-glutamate epimerase-like enolase superfamily enzyme
MAHPSTIRSLSVVPLDIPLYAPFGIAGGAQECAHNLLVTLELADGTRGYGEAAPFAAYNGETQEIAHAAAQAARATLEGADAREWRRIAAALPASMGHVGSMQCAIETALLDALTRQAHMPLWAFFGGVQTRLETDMTITTGTTEQARSAAQDIVQRGIHTIKIKVGSGDSALDLERILAVHAVAPAVPLILDGNCGYSGDTALALLDTLRQRNVQIALFEQPVPRAAWQELQQVAQQGGVPVAADESAVDTADVLRIAREGAAQVVNIKLMKRGIVEALDMAAICRAANLQLMIGGMVESILAMTTSACFAAGLGGFRYVDLDTPMFMAENPFTGGFAQQGGTLDVAHIAAGHGVTPTAQV